ncbi:MAG: hypothetical protein NTV51_19515, partial [Verrucomicrobia bacterium]|nr:hypothetical protein [Verrucomicrobiota bacterium]
MSAPFLFDAHLDLALNAIEWNRDLRLPLAEVRKSEAHLADRPGRGRGTVTFPEMVMPGDSIKMSIKLIYPVALEQGMHFAIR